ncbi:RNA polymerase sigma factor [Mangrovibacterium diazotrophicum]|uniref:RNA polymerase sigma factor n=1 Tax=Mangrovibacterium diazotrophicum TaxID=1261403 RepID=A0A419VX84_9BACT|nr:RNA polymerase sigma factor [Mangrovibacterium diazotrophicum]RKD87837.1 RNA polymerase sigma-70 factor (ECF subfamily) [Mangrovibacterium diazotrophicum]
MINEQQLINQLRNEETKQVAFRNVVTLYKERLYWHVRKIVLDHEDADDILQNTFIKVWRNIDSFRAESGLYTWLYRIATNESLTFLNQKKRKSFRGTDEEVNDYLVENIQADPYFNGDDLQLKLQEAIAKLPEKQRLVFNMRYYDDIKYQDMEKILDTSEGALKASYHHAVKKISEYLKKLH